MKNKYVTLRGWLGLGKRALHVPLLDASGRRLRPPKRDGNPHNEFLATPLKTSENQN